MKNKEKNNFTKLTHKKGISLIVLIITIIVIIILSAVVVMTISLNNPLSSAREAVFKEDISNFRTELELYKASMKYRDENPEELNVNRETTPHIQEVITSMPNKYAKILEVRDGKLVYIGNNKAEYLLANNMGMLPEDELLDDEIMEELQPFITEWTVSDNDSITLPITGGECNFTVDYGDGTGEYKIINDQGAVEDENITHTYEKAGTYTVTIKGKCQKFEFGTINISKDKITRLVQWGCTGFTSVNFAYCSNLSGEIPGPSENSFKNIGKFDYLFSNCSKLNGTIPEKLFANCPTVIRFHCSFSDCIGLTGKIPEELFANCSKTTSFSYTFSGCGGLTGEIPEKLFANCPEVTSFEFTFRNCTGLTGNIPEKLFANCTKVNSFRSTFLYCTGLSGSIPENLFANCLEVTSFYETFAHCKNLEKISENLFVNCNKVTNFTSTFYFCEGLVGYAPDLWKRENVTKYSSCFTNCTNLLNYNEIPSSWGGAEK